MEGETPRAVFDKILIAQLEENQEIECEVYLTKNIGENHIKWSPCEAVFYNYKRVFNVKNK